ncbi:hypothetical protein J6590_103239, partial [Homalodisca vitripennis]
MMLVSRTALRGGDLIRLCNARCTATIDILKKRSQLQKYVAHLTKPCIQLMAVLTRNSMVTASFELTSITHNTILKLGILPCSTL